MSQPAEIRLPERLDRAALAALRADVERLAGCAVAVVRGTGHGAFCRGISFDDVDAVDPAERDRGLADFEAAVMALVTSSTRTVACVGGDALGGGLGVAAACDVVVASEDARFGLPEPLFGLIPGLVLPLIRSRTGGPVVRLLALGGESIDAREAWRLGLADEVVPAAGLDGAVARWARRLARAEPGAAARLKRWLAEMDGLAGDVARGRHHLAELLGSETVARRVGRYQRGLAPWEEEDEDGTRRG
jgi:enoyl-CoA hydratase/carnithine racemase